MADPQQHPSAGKPVRVSKLVRQRAKRGILARPLEALMFLLPLMLFAELAAHAAQERLIASVLLQRFFQLFGPAGIWAPGLAVIVILLATHLASRQRWTIRWNRVGLMYVEAALLAAPLIALNWAIPLSAWKGPIASSMVDRIAMGIGAGIYEELIFRLIFLSLIVMVGVDLLHFGRTTVAVLGILVTSLVFAAHHHQPIGAEPFEATRFLFRTAAGVYLALIFWYRGYGSAAGCHAAYNVALVVFGAAVSRA